jgi:hypothetical protein
MASPSERLRELNCQSLSMSTARSAETDESRPPRRSVSVAAIVAQWDGNAWSSEGAKIARVAPERAAGPRARVAGHRHPTDAKRVLDDWQKSSTTARW